jgi:hypothetical protein
MRILTILPLAGLMAFGCKKKDSELPHSPIPSIEILSVSPGTIQENADSIRFEIHYTDGDGDLGENHPDARNLYIIDNRIGLAEAFRIPQLAPTGASIAIEGTLNITYPATGITNGSNSQGATFTVYVVDRAGHESERVVSQSVTIVR